MTSVQIRQSFLDFFKEKQHTIVSSSSLVPESPNIPFTNAGMNQFVPIFLGQIPSPYKPGRAADTQKCIRVHGKHNDLEDVGFDTYHHTFFEMLGNWSFGDYFKKEAIAWAWELVVERWKFPAERIYATVYKPGAGDPSDFDQEAYDLWAEIFTKVGLDPQVHIVFGNKKDNFWMMGETGPCGPSSEMHIDLTPAGDTKGSLVNKGDAHCIEIWNLVFIQFNATPDGKFEPLPAKHVDTGMGFERVCSMIQGTSNFTNFESAKISNYKTDIFRPLFTAISELSGLSYGATLPAINDFKLFSHQEKEDIAFRVIADHIRTLAFAIADGIIPSNVERGYFLRRILRRAVRYGGQLGLHEPFLYKLVAVLCETMGAIFPEIVKNRDEVERIIKSEEESFLRTLERGTELFHKMSANLKEKTFSGEDAFKLYDTYGFPLDLTQLMAREQGLTVDEAGFEKLMEEQQSRSQLAQKKETISVYPNEINELNKTDQRPFGELEMETKIVKIFKDQATVGLNKEFWVITESTPFYTEMGGQVSDEGRLIWQKNNVEGYRVGVKSVHKTSSGIVVHILNEFGDELTSLKKGESVKWEIFPDKRNQTQAHHSGTHIMHYALRKILGTHVGQKGSYVGPDRLRFDFSHGAAMTDLQRTEIEEIVNRHVAESENVSWEEKPYAEVKGDPNILQFFGDKYGDNVRVVSIGDYSKELCGGTHVRNTNEIGFFKIISEGAIAAGIRRIEAISGAALIDYIQNEKLKQEERYAALKRRRADLPAFTDLQGTTPRELWDSYSSRQTALEKMESDLREWEKQEAKQREAQWQSKAVTEAESLIKTARTQKEIPLIATEIQGEGAAYLPILADAIKNRWKGVAILVSREGGKVALLASVSPDFTKTVQAGKIIQTIAPLVGGKGGGKPDLAQGGGNQPEKIPELLAKVESLW